MKQAEKIKKWLQKNEVLYSYIRLIGSHDARVHFMLRRLVKNPQKHLDYMIKKSNLYGYGRLYPRTLKINLTNPTLFNEKLLWLKYYRYNKDPLIAKCYDKYTVREYVTEKGCSDILNELYGVWDTVEDIPWDKLPENCIIKKTNGSGNHVIIRNGEIDLKSGTKADVEMAKQVLRKTSYSERQLHIATGDLFENKSKQKYVCEKLLSAKEGEVSVPDYKFYCFNGEPRYLLYVWDRRQWTKSRITFKKINQGSEPVLEDRGDYYYHAENLEIPVPSSFNDMLEVCRKLAEPFPFVRVDLYDQDGHIVFGELTFTPAGSHVLYHVYPDGKHKDVEKLKELGDMIQI